MTTLTTPTSTLEPVSQTWVCLTTGNKGDLVAFIGRTIVLFRGLPAGVESGDGVRIDAKPAKSGRAYLGSVNFCQKAKIWAHGRGQTKDEVVKDFVRRQLAAESAHAELEAQRKAQAEIREREEQAARDLAEAAKAAMVQELGEELAAFVDDLGQLDPFYQFSDSQKVWRENDERRKELARRWKALSSDDQLRVLSDGRIDGQLRLVAG